MQQICDNLDSIGWKLQENNERKTPLLHKLMCFLMSGLEFFYYLSEKLPFLKNFVTSEGAVSHILVTK